MAVPLLGRTVVVMAPVTLATGSVPFGVRVHVYRNLHLPGRVWSVRRAGKVIGHRSSLTLEEASFRVQPGGQARARAQRSRNVHAYVAGLTTDRPVPDGPGRLVTYRPFDDDTFVDLTSGDPVTYARVVRFDEHGCTVWC